MKPKAQTYRRKNEQKIQVTPNNLVNKLNETPTPTPTSTPYVEPNIKNVVDFLNQP